MNSIIQGLHSLSSLGFDAVQFLTSFFSVEGQLFVISFLVGILFCYLYGRVSNQNAIKKVKARIKGLIFEGVLFRHDIRLLLRSQARLFLSALRYAGLSVKPILLLMIPGVLIFAQIDQRFRSREIHSGDTILLKVESKSLYDTVSLSASQNIDIAGPVRIPSEHLAVWRVQARDNSLIKDAKMAPELPKVILRANKEELVLSLSAGNKEKLVSYQDSSVVGSLLAPANFSMPSEISAISIGFTDRQYSFFGMSISWVAFSLIAMFAGGVLGAIIFKVSF